MRRTFLHVLLVVCLAVPACSSAQGPAVSVTPGKILFVGNSLTYSNDLPLMVRALADSARGQQLTVGSVTLPDFALVDHWNEGSALAEIRKGGWEYVVLQQGPSSVEVNRDSLRLFVRRFAMEITRTGGRPALYSVWPAADRRQDFSRAIESYQLASGDVNGMMLPVAAAWLAAWKRDPSIALYSFDGLHPSVTGSYLAALVIYAKMADRSPVGLPGRLQIRPGTILGIDDRLVPILQEAALEATR